MWAWGWQGGPKIFLQGGAQVRWLKETPAYAALDFKWTSMAT